MEENSKEVAFKKRKNQEILDFILFLKKKLKDHQRVVFFLILNYILSTIEAQDTPLLFHTESPPLYISRRNYF